MRLQSFFVTSPIHTIHMDQLLAICTYLRPIEAMALHGSHAIFHHLKVGGQIQQQFHAAMLSHVTNMLPLRCIFGQGYCYNSAVVFTANFLSWPMETTVAST